MRSRAGRATSSSTSSASSTASCGRWTPDYRQRDQHARPDSSPSARAASGRRTTVDTYWAFSPQGGCLAVADFRQLELSGRQHRREGRAGLRARADDRAHAVQDVLGLRVVHALRRFQRHQRHRRPSSARPARREHAQLINWALGRTWTSTPTHQRTEDENVNGVRHDTPRCAPSVHGDVIHSRPVAINFGTDASPQGRGVLRWQRRRAARHQRQPRHTRRSPASPPARRSGPSSPPEFFPQIKRLRDNTAPINFKGNTYPAPPLPKPYGIDGPILT